MTDNENTTNKGGRVDGFSDTQGQNTNVDAPDRVRGGNTEPLSPEERAKEEQDIRANGGEQDLKQ